MRTQRVFRLLTVGVLIAGASLAIPGSAPGSAAATATMLTGYTWTGGGVGDAWSQQCNWTFPPLCGIDYPDGPDDDATFPASLYTPWPVDLTTETIGDLTVEASVDFDTAGGTVTLSLTRLKIEPTSGNVEITMNGTAKITVP